MVDSTTLHDDMFVMDGLFPQPFQRETIDWALEGGIDAVRVTQIAYGDDFFSAVDAIRDTLSVIDEFDELYHATSVDDLRRDDGIGVLLGFQNSAPLEREREPAKNLRFFKELGVGIIQLTYNAQNYAGAGCTESQDTGLTDFGYEVIEAVEAQNRVLDLSHAGYQTAKEAIEASSQPVMFSHSNPLETTDFIRNIPDELMIAAAETGGTVGISSFDPMVGEEPTIDDFIGQIEYAADLIGAEHVTIGYDIGPAHLGLTEYTGNLAENPHFPDPPLVDVEGLETLAKVPDVTDRLLKAGFSEAEVRGIMGENLLELFETVWDD